MTSISPEMILPRRRAAQNPLAPLATLAARRFFFFQAEDGIRVVRVTGVQTCALPIYRRRSGRAGTAAARRAVGDSRGGAAVDRSEERRVGKECRSRWEKKHKKKK